MEEASYPERSYDYAYANPVQVANSLISILFYSYIYLLIYLFIFSNVQSLPEETDVGYMMMEKASCPEGNYDSAKSQTQTLYFELTLLIYLFAYLFIFSNKGIICIILYIIFLLIYLSQSFSKETDTGYMMMEGASCPERTCDYAYANPVEITPPSLISRSTRTMCVPFDASANLQSLPSVEVRSPAIYIHKIYEDTNNINAKNSLFTEGKNDCVKDECYLFD